MKGEIRNVRARGAQGRRAGFVSQALAVVLDALWVIALDVGILLLYGVFRMLLTGNAFAMPQPAPWVSALTIFVVGVLMLSSAWSGSGRAPGMAVLGLRVVTRDGLAVPPRRAFWRAVLVVPTLGLGVVTVLFSRRNASVYDMVCDTAVVYAWRPGLPETRQNW